MGRQAAKIYTSPQDIAMLERKATDLAMDARVRIAVQGQGVVEGVVAAAPTVQMFYDLDGNEGVNGMVKLEDPERPQWNGEIWLSDIVSIEHLSDMAAGAGKA